MTTISEDLKDQLPSLELLSDRKWRLTNLYYIKDKSGQSVPFKPNWAQLQLMKPHYLNIILKARQLGVTTFHALLFLDTCLFNENVHAAIIADSKQTAREIFVDKVKYAYDHLPDCIRALCPANRDNANELRFANGSVFRVGTSLRGGTIQLLHITEFAKICQENPRKAAEIMSGAINTVHVGQFICIESTARGREGFFYDMCKTAIALKDQGAELGQLDWKFWFFPWQDHPDYKIQAKNIVFPKELDEYFEKIEGQGVKLTQEQKNWYVKKMQTQGEYMKREYPSTPDEAFESANEGLYFGKQIAQARQEKRICYLPYDDHAKTYTAWDIGYNDETAIWVFQLVGKEIHLIDYYENSGEGLAHYVKWVREKPYIYEKHYFPFDADSKEKGSGRSYVDLAREMGLKTQVLPRAKNELFGIENLRGMINRMFFDEKKCAQGIKAIENFRKEWNDKLGCYRERALHDWASHGSKALIYTSEAVGRMSNGSGMTAEQWRRLRDEYIG
jgi:hypothetical protein